MGETSYKGASYTARELSSWMPMRTSADAELTGELPTLVARSRDLVRNNGIASGAVQTLVDNVVGGGFKLVSIPDNRLLGMDKEWLDNWARKVEALWRSWTESCACDAAGRLSFNTMTEIVFRSSIVSGEALALVLWLPQANAPFATRLQVIETDHLSNPHNTMNTQLLRDGVEVNKYGEPVAYHITKNHPNDFFSNNEWQRITAKTTFGRRRVLHIYETERIGQSRGKPLFASIMPLFKMLDHYERSELQASVVNAMIAAFVETPMDGENLAELFGGTMNDYLEARKEWNIKLQGGSVISVLPQRVMRFCALTPPFWEVLALWQFIKKKKIRNALRLFQAKAPTNAPILTQMTARLKSKPASMIWQKSLLTKLLATATFRRKKSLVILAVAMFSWANKRWLS